MPKEKTTVGQWVTEWLKLREAQLRPRTIERYDELIRLHLTPIEQRKLRKISPEEIQKLLTEICAAGHSRTAEQLYILLRACFKQAEIMGRVKRDPMRAVMRPKHAAQQHAVWTPEEQRRFCRALKGQPAELELQLGLLCGLRRGEICGLKWSDIDLQRGLIHVQRQRQRIAGGELREAAPKSASGQRDIPIPDALRGIMKARAAIGGYVCKYTPEGLRGALLRAERRAGVPHIGLHGLRHTMATNAVRSGASLRTVQKLLGHSSFTLTASIYTHPDIDMLRDALESASKIVI